jgi:hypothetical protein
MRLWMCAGLGLLGSCGEEFQYKVACDNVFGQICEHQVECGIQYDQYLCETELKANLECDQRKTVTELDVCREALDQASCTLAIPCECYLVLCDTNYGCGQTSTEGTCNYGSSTTPSG